MDNYPIQKTKIMFGTGASSVKNKKDLKLLITEAILDEIMSFDTAPSYGTEAILGECLSECINELNLQRHQLFIQTKIDAWQMMESKQKIKSFVLTALEKLKVEYLDSLLIHWPVPECFEKTWEVFVELKQDGLVKNIGVCNVRLRQLLSYLEMGVKPDIVQIERNPLRICEKEVQYCKDHDIWIQAYSPLCKMHDDIKSSMVLSALAQKYERNIGQIVMRWHIETGVTPVFTSTKSTRIKEYSSLFDFSLERKEVEKINMMNKDYKMFLEACACPGF